MRVEQTTQEHGISSVLFPNTAFLHSEQETWRREWNVHGADAVEDDSRRDAPQLEAAMEAHEDPAEVTSLIEALTARLSPP